MVDTRFNSQRPPAAGQQSRPPNVIVPGRQVDNPQLAAREQRRRDRLGLIKENNLIARVRVTCERDDIRKMLRHPANGKGFPEGGGSVEWPNDAFTKRRLRDNDIQLADKNQDVNKPASEQPDETRGDTDTEARAPNTRESASRADTRDARTRAAETAPKE